MPAAHHIVPRFHLRRWANPQGMIEVHDRQAMDVREEDPARFYALPDFNRMEKPDGSFDPWLEHEFLGGLDTAAATIMRQLENVPAPLSQLRLAKHRPGWSPMHLMSPERTVRFALYIGAQATRSPAWRDAFNQQLATGSCKRPAPGGCACRLGT